MALTSNFVQAEDLSNAEKERINQQIKSYIMENPEIILEALQVLKEKEDKRQADLVKAVIQENETAIFNDGYSFVGGNPEGSITLVEFLDYQCGFCKKARPIVTKFLEDNDHVRYIVKEFPVLGENSITAAKAALASLKIDDGKHYEAFHAALMDYKKPLDEATILKIAEDSGLNIKRLKQIMGTSEIDEQIKSTLELAKTLQIRGTPYFVFGDQIIQGLPDVSVLNEIAQKSEERQ